MKTSHLIIAALCLAGALQLSTAVGEDFLLKSGGRVTGELLKSNQIARTDYVVRTAEGVVFKLDRSQVAKAAYSRPEQAEYEKIWPRFADTVEDQWKIAEWCRENTLLEQREDHLKRIIHLDPDHEAARRILGFTRRGGKWATRDDSFQSQGYVHYEGEWRSPQEIQLIEEDRRSTDAHTAWLTKLKRYRDQLASGNGAAEARQAILEIKDPAAIGALGKALSQETNANIRELYLHALGNMGTDPSAMALAMAYMNEPVEELRYTCLDHLKNKHVAVDYFVANLNGENTAVNRAGFALGYLENPSAIGPLIRALTTSQKVVIKGNGNQTSTSFDNRGGMGLSAGGSDKIVNVNSYNRAVLDALVKLTGQSYGYDKGLWKSWHANQRRYEHINARRD